MAKLKLIAAMSIFGTIGLCVRSIPLPSLTGILDEATADSLSAFQYLAALPVTGNLDKNTWKHLTIHYPLAAVLNEKGIL